MRIVILVLLLTIPSIVLAERMFDGFYASAGYTYFENKTRLFIFEDEIKFSEWVPKVSLGYGKSSKRIGDTNYRMYLGIDTFYIGELENFAEINMLRVNRITIKETREFQQQSTRGIGARVGLVDDSEVLGGNLYIDFGYAETEIEGMFSTDSNNGAVRERIKQDSVTFKGGYWGVGYELATRKNIALRIEVHRYDYDDEELSSVRVNSGGTEERQISNGISLDNTSLFLGLTGRF